MHGVWLACIGAFATTGSTDPAKTQATASAPPDPSSSCCGTERATLGSLFHGITLGQTTRPTLPPAAGLGPYIGLELEMNATRVDAIVIRISDMVRQPPLCPVLQDRLAKAWGPPTDHRWEAGDRAVEFTTGDPPSCALRFYRMTPPEQWLNASRESVVPIWAIGRPITELRVALAPLQPEERDPKYFGPSIRWQDISISGDKIWLTAFHQRGRVIGIAVELDEDRGLKAWRRLDAMFGAPDPAHVHEDTQSWKWRRGPGISLSNWVGALPRPAPGQPVRTQDMHPTKPFESHTAISFGVIPSLP